MGKIKRITNAPEYLKELLNNLRFTKNLAEKTSQQVEQLRREVNESLLMLSEDVRQNNELLLAARENIEQSKTKLNSLRQSDRYKAVFKAKEPLVSIRIATYNRADLLVDRAIKSILNQTYQNFEIVVVGDHCTDDTEERIKKLNDDRIRFYNLPQRTFYPEDKYKRWLVVGAAPANKAVELAKGDWIATLDDDDEYLPNHIETLVNRALKTKSEFVYNALESIHEKTKQKKIIWSDPPKHSQFSMMGALYLRELYKIFKTDEQGWVARLPQDWYLCKRMLEAGVKYSASNEVTGKIHLLTYQEKEDI